MDPSGKVAAAVGRRLPARGTVLDVGAGDGHIARRLTTRSRRVVPVEPALGMIAQGGPLPWVRADAERLPFAPGSLDAAYATWAYFFPDHHDITPGLAELHRVVRPGGPLLVADNVGGDEFTALAAPPIAADPEVWAAHGFECEVVETAFVFADITEARLLLGHFFGERGRARAALRLSFRVGVFAARSRGPGT